MEKIKFAKMHGTGNDYVIVDMTTNYYQFDPAELSRRISDRHFGIGSDGLILIQDSKTADFKMRIFNADGSEAEMCGNGIRCFAKYLYDHRLTNRTIITVETGAGIKTVELAMKNGAVIGARVDMGEPILEGSMIPVAINKNPVLNEEIEIDGKTINFTAVSMGNPHCVIFTDELSDELVTGIGPKIETHPLFPKKVNVEFAKIVDESTIQMRVWERGSGETMACGTGASATAVAAALNQKTGRKVTVQLPGGRLGIEWNENNHVYMSGPAVEVFEGIYRA